MNNIIFIVLLLISTLNGNIYNPVTFATVSSSVQLNSDLSNDGTYYAVSSYDSGTNQVSVNVFTKNPTTGAYDSSQTIVLPNPNSPLLTSYKDHSLILAEQGTKLIYFDHGSKKIYFYKRGVSGFPASPTITLDLSSSNLNPYSGDVQGSLLCVTFLEQNVVKLYDINQATPGLDFRQDLTGGSATSQSICSIASDSSFIIVGGSSLDVFNLNQISGQYQFSYNIASPSSVLAVDINLNTIFVGSDTQVTRYTRPNSSSNFGSPLTIATGATGYTGVTAIQDEKFLIITIHTPGSYQIYSANPSKTAYAQIENVPFSTESPIDFVVTDLGKYLAITFDQGIAVKNYQLNCAIGNHPVCDAICPLGSYVSDPALFACSTCSPKCASCRASLCRCVTCPQGANIHGIRCLTDSQATALGL